MSSARLQKLLNHIAPGLTRRAQMDVLFQTYELSPELFQLRIQAMPTRARQSLIQALDLAREYSRYREGASVLKRIPQCSPFPRSLLRSLSPEIRTEAREWMGFWAQSRQGVWSEVQWVERGVRTHVNFEAQELFARCLPLRPKALVLIHNHPSGNTDPSWIDLQLTRKVGELAHHLGIELKGHWIVGPHSETWLPLDKML